MAATGVQTRAAWPATGAAHVRDWLEAERHQLPLWLPVALGIGVAAWFLLPWEGQRLAVAALFATLAAAAAFARGLAARLLFWGGALALLGMAVAEWRSRDVAAPVLDRRFTGEVTATVLRVEAREGRGDWRLVLAPAAGQELPPKIRITLKRAPPTEVLPGATIRLRAGLAPPAGPSLPGGYDFARRAWFEGLGATGYPLGKVVIVTPAPPPSGIVARMADLRVRLTARFQDAIPGSAGAIAAALVAGDQGAIPEATRDAMRDSGLAHLLSISGLHIAVVAGGAFWLARKAQALWPWWALRAPVKSLAAGVAALAAVGYTILAGGEVPTVRSCIAVLIVLAGVIVGREALTLRLVATGAFLILLARPEALLGPSFQLSFAAVTAIVALYQSPLGRRMSQASEGERWWRRFGRHLLTLLVTGLVAEAALSATALFHFGQAGLYGVVANLLAIPLTSFVLMPLLALALALDPLGLAGPAFWLLGHGLEVLIGTAEAVAGWPGAVGRIAQMPMAAYALIAGGGLWLCLWSRRPRWAGLLPIAAGVAVAAATTPPDILISADGRHVAVRTEAGLALLRERTGDFLRDMWGDAVASDVAIGFEALPGARCSVDACVARLDGLTLLATRSRDIVPYRRFEPACAAADLVVSDRRLPDWCAPRWRKLDRPALERTGAVAIRLDGRELTSVGAQTGDHPWKPRSLKRRPWVPRSE